VKLAHSQTWYVKYIAELNPRTRKMPNRARKVEERDKSVQSIFGLGLLRFEACMPRDHKREIHVVIVTRRVVEPRINERRRRRPSKDQSQMDMAMVPIRPETP
jgi:hypothetical protein